MGIHDTSRNRMATEKRQITLGTTYYNNPDLLANFIQRNLPHVDELIVVDDGSMLPASDYIEPHDKIKLYRVTKDYGFNSHGCRNLIMRESTNDWVVMIDVDRQFDDPEFAFDTFKTKPVQPNTLYRFEAYHNKDYSDLHVSVNDFLIHRNHFFSAGGYDEELIGVRAGDRHYFEQLLHFGYERTIRGILMRLMRGASVNIRSKQLAPATSPNDILTIDVKKVDIVRRRMKQPEPNKPILTFDWVRVF